MHSRIDAAWSALRKRDQSRTTTSRSVPDSAPQTSPGRPSSWRTEAPRLLLAEALEFLGHRVEAQDGVGEQIAEPDLVLVVDIDRVAAGFAPRQAPHFPGLGDRIEAADFAGVPEAHPQQALGVRPDAARTDAGLRRRHHQCIAAHGVDLDDVIAGERGVPDIAARRGGDAVRSDALRRLEGVDLAGRRIDAAIDAVLPGEPEDALAIEGRGVEIGVGKIRLERGQLHRPVGGIHWRDRVLSALGDPGGAIGPDDHTMWRRARPERNLRHLAGLRIEDADRALALRGVPDRAVRRRRHVMRMRTTRHVVIGNLRGRRRFETERKHRHRCGNDTNHVTLHISRSGA